MVISIPSFILRDALKGRSKHILNGIDKVLVAGKIIRRTKNTSVIFDSFCGLSLCNTSREVNMQLDKSVDERRLVKIVCFIVKHPCFYLSIISVEPISFQEEMYLTLEAIEYWSVFLSQKQPK